MAIPALLAHPLVGLAAKIIIPKIIDKSNSSKKEELKAAVQKVSEAVTKGKATTAAAAGPAAGAAVDYSQALPVELQPYAIWVNVGLAFIAAILATWPPKNESV